MKRPLLASIFVLLFCHALTGQVQNWQFTGYGPHFRHFNAVQVLNDGRMVAVGGNPVNDAISSIFYSDDTSSTTWSIVIDSINSMLNDVHFADNNVGYTAGNAGVAYKSIDHGTSWSTVALPASVTNRNYYGVRFLDANTGVFVGGKDSIQTILRTTDGGASWTIIRDTIGRILRDVFFVDALTGFACGDSGSAYTSADGGLTWSALTLPAGMNARNFVSAHFLDSQIGFFAGGTAAPDSVHTIIKTLNGGASWTVIIDSAYNMINSIFFINSTEGYIGGEKGMLRHTNDQGQTWTSFTVPGNDTYSINDIHFLHVGLGLAAGGFGKTLVYVDPALQAPSAVIAGPFTVINSSTVQIDGLVNANNDSTTVEFEWGLTTSFGNTVNMTPSVTVGNNVPVSVVIPGLALSNIYYGRIKVTNMIGTSYSSTITFFPDSSAIPNFSFEFWNDYTYEYPFSWGSVGEIQRVNSYNGSFALHARAGNLDTPGAIFYANVTGNGPVFSGMPFSGGRPDTLQFHMKYDVVAGDSALAWIFLSSGGSIISDTTVKIPGSSSGLFEDFRIPLSYSSAAIPDSIAIFFLSTNYFGGNVSLISEITVDDVMLIGSTVQVPNNDFEQWDTITRNQASSWFSHDDMNFMPMDSSDVRRSTDAYHGNYAIMLRCNSANRGSSTLKSGPNIYNYNNPDFPVYSRNTALYGYYKFAPQLNDTFYVQVMMYKLGVQIGNAYYAISAPASSYTLFTIPISYFNSDIPDSASITFRIGKNDTTSAIGNSWVLIDALGFDGVITETPPQIPDSESPVLVYPNPASDQFTVSFGNENGSKSEVNVYDVTGRLLSHEITYMNRAVVDCSSFESQTLFIEVIINDKYYYTPLILTR